MKLVLGVAGLAGFALLGAGGALLVKHLLSSDSRSGAPAVRMAPTGQARPGPAAPSTTLHVVPVAPAQAVASMPDASGTAPLPPTAAGPDASAIQAPTRTARRSKPTGSTHAEGRPPVGVNSEAGATAAAADRANCLAAVNAVNADLSLRNEPPTPQQLAILRRGCK